MINNPRFSILLITMFFLSAGIVTAQDRNVAVPATPKKDWKQKVFFGGGLGANFGSQFALVEVSPLVGYRFTEKLSAGVGLSYIYYREKLRLVNSAGQLIRTYTLETNNYGGRIFGRYFVLEDVFIHTEFEMLNYEVITDFTSDKVITTRENIPALFVGGGYSQRLGGNSSLFIMALWDVIEDKNSPYQNPTIRIGFNVGF